MRKLLLYLLIGLPFSVAFGQNYLSKSKTIVVTDSVNLIDSFPIITESVLIKGYEKNSDYTINTNSIRWLNPPIGDTVLIIYRYLKFETIYKNKDPSIIQPVFEENPFAYKPPPSYAALSSGGLKTSGNISRGLGFGNTQDVVVNSNLNLRLNGTLADDVRVLAVISDENNPIQPEGNTQQIQDFDQVYITLQKDSGKLTIGDFLMAKNEESYFINFYKKSRGVQFENVSHTKKWRVAQNGEAAIARGRFSRNTIDGIEGNAGPYRLSGSNGEIFIIVIAATEKVFLDGRLLVRGEDNDYVINYNTGEITFTPKVLITRYSRIVVEFQYSDRNYARSVSRLGGQMSKKNITIYTNFYNEMDLKTQPFQQSLDGFDSSTNLQAIDILAQAGDQPAFFSNVRKQAKYNPDRVMYKEVISGSDTFYQYADNPTENVDFYDIVFSNVGSGNGSYTQTQSGANGKVFAFVGQGQGDYDPIDVLVAPKRLNMFNLGVIRKDSNQRTGIEISVSGLDENTLSPIDDGDNLGYGVKTFNEFSKILGDSSPWKFNSRIDYEMVTGGFNFVERYRTVEFDRNWNKVISNPNSLLNLLPSLEHIGNANFELATKNGQKIGNQFSLFIRPGNFSGYSNTAGLKLNRNQWFLSSSFQLLNSTNDGGPIAIGNNFNGWSANVEKRLPKIRFGGNAEIEQSDFLQNDSLIGQSYGFNAFNAYFNSSGENKIEYGLSVGQRQDYLPKEGSFVESTLGRDISFNSSFRDAKNNRIQLLGTYRRLEIGDTSLSSNPEENTVQSRLELDYRMFKKFVRSKTFYQIGTGQEQRREFQYLQVQSGNGIYIWNDYDSNGVKTLNEFEIASDLDQGRADYIKIFTPVAGFFSTNSNKFSQTLELKPAVFVKRTAKKQPFIGRFYSLTSFISENKVLPSNLSEFINPFSTELNDSMLMNSSRKLRTSLFYNRSNPVYGLDYTFLNNRSKVLLTNGFDSRESIENRVNARVNIGNKFTLLLATSVGDRSYTSQFFTARSYDYNFVQTVPRLQYVHNNVLRIELKSDYFLANNQVALGGEKSENIEFGLDAKWSRADKGTFQIGTSIIQVDYTGDPNSTLGYELLRGLKNGTNATWKLNYQRTISNNIQFIVTYDGRKSELNEPIHIGRVLARYLF